jgi:hypothetical protein
VRTYFETDIRRVAQSIFGPEPVKIKSLSKSAATDDISLQLEAAKVSIDAEVMKFSTDDGWTEATIFLRDITEAKLDMKATFQYTDPALATTVTLVSLMFESKTANLQLLVTDDRGRAIIQAIDTAREAWMTANRERLQKRREAQAVRQAQQEPAGAPAVTTAPAMSLTPADDGASSGSWGADSMAVPAGWPPTGAVPAPAPREEDSPGAFGGTAGGWGDAVLDAMGGGASEPKATPAVGGGVDLLGGAASGGVDLLTAAGGMSGAGQLDASMFATDASAPAPAPAIGGGMDLLGGGASGGGVDLLSAAGAGGMVGGGGMMGGGQLDAGLFATDTATDDAATGAGAAAAEPASMGGDGGGGDGWGASATAIPEGWPTMPK